MNTNTNTAATATTATATAVSTVVVRDSSFLGRNGANRPELRRILDVGGNPHVNGIGGGRWYEGDWTEVLPADGWTQEELDAVPLFEGH